MKNQDNIKFWVERCLMEKTFIEAISMAATFENERVVKRVKSLPNEPFDTCFKHLFWSVQKAWLSAENNALSVFEHYINSSPRLGSDSPDAVMVYPLAEGYGILLSNINVENAHRNALEHTRDKVLKDNNDILNIWRSLNIDTNPINFIPIVVDKLYSMESGDYRYGFTNIAPAS